MRVEPVSSGQGPARAVIVGAGIAGLSLSHGLARLGYGVRVLERGTELRAEGAGLTLWPNAVHALRSLGLDNAVEERAHTLAKAATVTPAGETVAEVPLDRIAERFGRLLSIHRGDLLQGLLEQSACSVEFGAEVCLDDGTLQVHGEPLEGDLIVGADGIRSTVREAIAPGIFPRPAGYGAWRGVADTGKMTPDGATEAIGRGRRFGLVPLSGGRTYWFAVTVDCSDGELEHTFADWHRPIGEVLAATSKADRSYLPLSDLPSLPRRHYDRAVLVGDAAHAMTPNLGQGAAQALRDVAVLCSELAGRPLSEALASYQSRRKRRAERVVRQSRAVGRIAQASNPLAVGLRDLLARKTPTALAVHQFGQILRT